MLYYTQTYQLTVETKFDASTDKILYHVGTVMYYIGGTHMNVIFILNAIEANIRCFIQ